MIPDQEKVTKILNILKFHPKGLTISDISKKTGLNRNVLAKFLEILLITGKVERRKYGAAKVYFISRRVPITTIFRFASDMILVLDSEMRISQVNDHMLSYAGMREEDLIGVKITELNLFPISDLPAASIVRETITGGEIVREVNRLKDGIERFFRVKFIPTVFENGKEGTTVILEDTTLRKQFERQLVMDEARYRAVVEDQTELICRRRPDGTISFANGAYCRYFKKKPGELIDTSFRPTIPENDQAIVLETPTKFSEKLPVITYEHRIVLEDGETRWQQWTDRALYDDNGRCIEYQSVGRDITAQKESEREHLLRESVIALSTHAIGLVDMIGNLIYANPAFLFLWGYEEEQEVLGKPLEKFVQRTSVRDNIHQVLTPLMHGGAWSGPVMAKKRDGTKISVLLTGSMVTEDRYISPCMMAIFVAIVDRGHPEGIIHGSENDASQQRAREILTTGPADIGRLIEFIPYPTFIVDAGKMIIAWNRAMEFFTGVGREQILGTGEYRRAFSFYQGERPVLIDILDLPAGELAEKYPSVLRFGDSIFLEGDVPGAKGGQGAFIWGKASPLIGPDGNHIGAIESVRDISDLKAARESHRQRREQIDATLSENLSVLIELANAQEHSAGVPLIQNREG